MSKVEQAGVLEVWVAGVGFRHRRRSTLMMAEARGLMAAVGQLAGAGAAPVEVSESKAADMIQAVLKVALVSINDGETKGEDGGPWAPIWDWYTVDELDAFSDALFTSIMQSGLAADPTPPSCAG